MQQRFNLTRVSSETGAPEQVAEGVKFSDGSCVVNWERTAEKYGITVFESDANISDMYPDLTVVIVDPE